MAERQRFRGVYPVLYAFWNADGTLDEGAMAAQVEHCLAVGAHGITVLGLVTEVHRMDTGQRRQVVEVVGSAIAGRVPYAVTIAEPEPDAQVAFAQMAADNGADWVILQPPPGVGHAEADLRRHFGSIADRLDLPVAVQNNPVNLASSLSADGLIRLVRDHPNITLLKAEGWSVEIARVLDALGDSVDAFGGHGGLEYISLIRSGGSGLIPAPDCLAAQVAIFEALTSGNAEAIALAEALHKELLPLIVFMTRTIPGILIYGKRVMARRMGLSRVHDLPGLGPPTAFGLAEMERVLANAVAAEDRILPKLRTALSPARGAITKA